MNYARTALLLAAMTGLFLAIGYLLGGAGGAMIAFVIALAMNAWSFWNSDKAVLRMQGARPVTRAEAPELVGMVEDLARKGDLPTPAAYIMDTAQPNAFATGRDPENAAVAVTRGLMNTCSEDELAGVIAHELAHIKNRDTLIMTVTATIAGAIGFLTQFGLFFGRGRDNPLGMIGTLLVMFLAPVAAMLVQMAISRTREFSADKMGAEICGHPEWLASALQLIERQARGMTNPRAQDNPASAHLFIINPLRSGGVSGLFRTHPPTAERVKRLMDLAPGGGAGRPAAATKRPWD
ncbi:MAG: zinc metalloprotease HtpX [Alphaproteobacteria bacterium]|nr:zinc metalloprotease HtpX [Alphaproteobacteria bacterium]